MGLAHGCDWDTPGSFYLYFVCTLYELLRTKYKGHIVRCEHHAKAVQPRDLNLPQLSFVLLPSHVGRYCIRCIRRGNKSPAEGHVVSRRPCRFVIPPHGSAPIYFCGEHLDIDSGSRFASERPSGWQRKSHGGSTRGTKKGHFLGTCTCLSARCASSTRSCPPRLACILSGSMYLRVVLRRLYVCMHVWSYVRSTHIGTKYGFYYQRTNTECRYGYRVKELFSGLETLIKQNKKTATTYDTSYICMYIHTLQPCVRTWLDVLSGDSDACWMSVLLTK